MTGWRDISDELKLLLYNRAQDCDHKSIAVGGLRNLGDTGYNQPGRFKDAQWVYCTSCATGFWQTV